ncbi:hypothetical protein E3C22_12810 [Jiella endophytica]|uniref:Tetratricopeptide repeat protein n=1 Tax=Jiella endophytica TaxID=2558362 RepID=A0A4Y8RJS1_9HYPH|nr:hypothetical protein [Jiella endophytica]TFF23299.1 hypothetical protein E3C22_12810 [Jiella endophytica]
MAVINAMYVADELGFEFKFFWPGIYTDKTFHQVEGPEQIFSRSFIDRHFLAEYDESRYITIRLPEIPKKVLQRLDQPGGPEGLSLNVYKRMAAVGATRFNRRKFAHYWNRIEFVDHLEDLRWRHAAGFPDFDVGLHVRRGDILEGMNRLALYNGKYTPVAVADGLINDFKARNKQIVLFSNDGAFIRRYETGDVVVGIQSFYERFGVEGELQKSFFDIMSMSKCSVLLARNSAFANLANTIGTDGIEDPVTFYQSILLRDHLTRRAGELGTTDLEKAKELQWAVDELPAAMDNGLKIELLEAASSFDPTNWTYRHLRAMAFIAAGDLPSAETEFRASAEAYFERNGRLLPEFFGRPNVFHTPSMESLTAREWPSPFIAAHAAAQRSVTKDREAAVPIARKAFRMEPGHPLLRAFFVQRLLDAHGYEEAEAVLAEEGGVSDAPVFVRQRATVLAWRKRFTEAAETVAKLRWSGGDDEDLRILHAHYLSQAGKTEPAAGMVADIDAAGLDDIRAILRIVGIDLSAGRIPAARKALSSAQEKWPQDARLRSWETKVQAREG